MVINQIKIGATRSSLPYIEMAFYDNTRFLLSHIRHSFITCDDTGMCEMVMLHEVIPRDVTPLHLSLIEGQETSAMDYGQLDSPDIEQISQAELPFSEQKHEVKSPTNEQRGGPSDGFDTIDAVPSELSAKNKFEKSRTVSSILDYWDMAADSDLFESGQSFDIVSDMELIGAHRPRSNTAQRLERMKKERKTQAKVRVVQWRDAQQASVSGSAVESAINLPALFPKKVIEPKLGGALEERVSALTEQLKRFPSQPSNPFKDYVRFDGKMSEDGQRKKISIYLTMQEEDDRNYPMEVITFTHAKVQDLVGLICWQYTREGRKPKLKPSANCYCLRIAEETGEVDEDFPSLESKEPVAKFDFPVLALVEKEEEGDHVVTMYSIIFLPFKSRVVAIVNSTVYR